MRALTRRAFLAGATGTAAAAATALAAGGLGGLLAACDSAAVNADLLHQPQPPNPFHPVTWPIFAANKPIADGLLAERDATLAVYTWPGRLAAECVDKFERKYGCQVQVITFGSMRQAMVTMTTKPTRFDVFLGVPVAMLGTLVRNSLIQPLNHSYIPNISQAWQQFTNPFYDQGWRYTVPYTVYSTGIGWRRDLLTDADPYSMVNGWDLLWQPKYKGEVAILADYREGISLGLLYNGITNLNTADPMLIDTAARSLDQLASVRMRLSNNAFSDLAAGNTKLQQAWSGQVAAAGKSLPRGTPVDAMGYWFPPNGSGPVANDTITIPRSAQNPVLAHLFANFMLDTPNAVDNTRGIGYVQPMNWITPARLVRHGVLPPSLIDTVVLEGNFFRGLKELQLPTAADALWQQAWQSVETHMHLSPIR